MENKNNLTFTKELFIETINEIEKQVRHDRKCSDAFKILLPNDFTSNYDNHWLYNSVIKILQIAMNDVKSNSWIEFYAWELDFGLKWSIDSVQIKGESFKLQSAEDLWNLLNL